MVGPGRLCWAHDWGQWMNICDIASPDSLKVTVSEVRLCVFLTILILSQYLYRKSHFLKYGTFKTFNDWHPLTTQLRAITYAASIRQTDRTNYGNISNHGGPDKIKMIICHLLKRSAVLASVTNLDITGSDTLHCLSRQTVFVCFVWRFLKEKVQSPSHLSIPQNDTDRCSLTKKMCGHKPLTLTNPVYSQCPKCYLLKIIY